ncbi:cache domain-containing protein [Paracoccus siganidrum]|uniref:histidine kinase n=1 Tax=Paracoccus siganidrum TaxID=1276757 RepID=A0A419A7R3_9RHOB|nr:cache domain-containing protein [Paracoccus siganidrum]RJL16594.1 PAS domain S-box protein [Paracoccus siganidrum]RMC34548.1 histidine kinase [Paracoccus siganidrum]
MRNSLGALLAIGLAGLQFVAVLVIVFSSYLTSERALLDHARNLLSDVGTNTIEHSKGFLNPARGAAELAARLAQNHIVASDNPDALEQLLFQQLQITPQFAGLYYGSEDGGFVYVMRSAGPGPFRTKFVLIDGEERTTELVWRDDDFNVIERQFDPADTFDPRTRPWYVRAREAMGTIWTDPYIFFSSQQPGITLSAPVLNDGDGIRGVVGVDIEISEISDFLARLKIGDTGKAMIINRNGDVIAHPNPDLIKTEDSDGTLRFTSINEIEDPIARAAFGSDDADPDFLVSKEEPFEFSHDGAVYVSTLMPIISEILPWTIAVYAPEDDFTQVIKKNREDNLWIAALVAGITGFIGLLLAEFIHKPVKAFAVRSALISQGEIDPSEPLPRTYKELAHANETLVQQIVARKKTEQEYGQTFDLASRGMAQIEPATGRFLRVNASLCEMTGYDAAELTGMRISDLAQPGSGVQFASGEGPLDASFAINQEAWLLRKDGRPICAAVNAILIRDHEGRPLHAVVTIDDVTESKEKESQIAQLNSDLSHLARGNTMGQMAAGLAHELNQPLAVIAQDADTALLMLDQDARRDPELREILAEIEQQSHRAADIIRALRGFIRKDEGTRTAFDFVNLFGQTRRLVQAEANQAGVTIRADLGDLPPVLGNRIQVAQVLVNLLRNAIEAIAGDPQAERIVTVTARRDGDRLEVAVRDTGPGIAQGVNLFSQFATTKRDGMGLGLSICRTMVEANGGRLWHDPEVTPGACFRFTLPFAATT